MSKYDSPQTTLDEQDKYGLNEVGITHPDVSSFIRIRDDGNIEISAGDVAIVLNPNKGSITLVADTVKFMTKTNGLRWNRSSFNEDATNFNEPTFLVENTENNRSSAYRDVEYFLDDIPGSFSSDALPESVAEALEDEEIIVDY